MRVIVGKGNGVLHLIRDGAHDHLDAERAQEGHEFVVEVRHRAWRQRHGVDGPLIRGEAELVINEVEINGEGPTAIRDRGRGEATGGHIEGYMPPMVHRWTQGEPNL